MRRTENSVSNRTILWRNLHRVWRVPINVRKPLNLSKGHGLVVVLPHEAQQDEEHGPHHLEIKRLSSTKKSNSLQIISLVGRNKSNSAYHPQTVFQTSFLPLNRKNIPLLVALSQTRLSISPLLPSLCQKVPLTALSLQDQSDNQREKAKETPYRASKSPFEKKRKGRFEKKKAFTEGMPRGAYFCNDFLIPSVSWELWNGVFHWMFVCGYPFPFQ